MDEDILKYYDYALTMQAAYAELTPASIGENAVDLELRLQEPTANFTATKAEEFVLRFDAISHKPNDTNSGFSATLFRDTEDNNKKILAIRGTEEPYLDLFDADILEIGLLGIALKQSIALYNYVNGLFEGERRQVTLSSVIRPTGFGPDDVEVLYSEYLFFGNPFISTYYFIEELDPIVVKEEEALISNTEKIIVSGHSLGGHLAAVATLLFPDLVEAAYTYNGAGNNGPLSKQIAFTAIAQITGNGHPGAVPTDKIIGLQSESSAPGDDADAVTEFAGDPFSPQREIIVEVQGAFGLAGHSKVQLADSLKLYDLFATLDANVSEGIIAQILVSASNVAEESIESLTESLAAVFGIDVSLPIFVDTEPPTARDQYHQLVESIHQVVSVELHGGDFVIESIPTDIATLAIPDTLQARAYRYALEELNSFAIYSDTHSTAMDDPKYDASNYSKQYLNDRAAMLSLLMKRNVEDITSDESTEPNNGKDVLYSDKTNPEYNLTTGEAVLAALTDETSVVRFGSDSADGPTDGLAGTANNDRLFGMAGNDELEGLAGNDRLEGGKDDDTYIFNTTVFATGNDKIFDIDGDNTLTINGKDVSRLYQPDPTVAAYNYQDANGKVLATFNHRGKQMDIHFLEGEGGFVTIEKFGITFSENKFGLTTEDQNEELPEGGSWVFTQGEFTELGEAETTFVHTESNEILYPPPFSRFYNSRQFEIPNHGSTTFNQISLTFDAATYGSYAHPDVFWGGGGGPLLGFGIEGGELADRLTGGDVNDFILGISGDDIIHGGDNPADTYDFIWGGAGNDYLYGEDGNDAIWGNANGFVNIESWIDPDSPFSPPIPEEVDDSDLIVGGAGDDLLTGGNYNDTIFGGDDNDWIFGGAGSDFLAGDAGDDVIHGDMRGLLDVLESGQFSFEAVSSGGFGEAYTYDDYIYGGAGADTLYGGAGNDQVFGGKDDDQLHGDDPDAPVSEHGDDLLDGGPGNDKLWGGEGDDELLGGEGDDQLYGEAGDDVLRGGAGVDLLYGGEDDDDLYGGSEDDQLIGEAGDDILYGGEGADQMWGGEDDDDLFGGIGDDQLQGDAGDDILTGGLGNDVLRGGAGDDHYWYSLGDGIDTIDDTQGQNVLKLAFSVSEVSHLQGNSGSRFLVLNNGDFIAFTPGTFETMQLQFAGGGSLDTANFDEQITLDEATTLTTGDGNDVVWGSPGSDTINTGGGNDTVYGDGNNATGAGDVIHGGSGDDTLRGNWGDDTLYGDEGNDTLDGDEGDDTLIGGLGDDVYTVWTGEGDDTIDNTDAGNGHDVLVLAGGVNPASTSLSKVGDNLLIDTGAETVTVLDHFRDYGSSANQTYAIDLIQFYGSGTNWTQQTIASAVGLPYALGESFTRSVNQPLVLSFASLLANDSAGDNGPLTIISVSNAVNGSVSRSELNQTVTFIPDNNFAGEASFDYTASDGAASVTASLLVTVENNLPVAVDDDLVTGIDETADILFASLLANDSDVDGQPLTISAVGNSLHGSVSLDEVNETVSFVPEVGYSGSAEFDYVVSDGYAGALGSVSIYVGEVPNDPPVAEADQAATDFEQALEIPVADLLSNDSDPEGDPISFVGVDNAIGGSVVYQAGVELVTFTPEQGFSGSASFSYTISDGRSTAAATVSVDVADPVSPDAVFDLSTIENGDGSLGYVLNGANQWDQAGSAVSSAGDINGDGIGDFLIGASNFGSQKGAVYVVFGSEQDITGSDGRFELSDIASSNGALGFLIHGFRDEQYGGIQVTAVGDINADGIDDVIIGGAKSGTGNQGLGPNYVIFGSTTDITGGDGEITLQEIEAGDGSLGFAIDSSAVGNGSGATLGVTSAGDINDDGINDWAVGIYTERPGYGSYKIYVVFGSDEDVTNATGSFNLASLENGDGSRGWVIDRPNPPDNLGGGSLAAGDINGDGIDDLIIGEAARSSVSKSFVVFGSAQDITGGDGVLESSAIFNGDGSLGFVINGARSRDQAGNSVAAAGDFNNDGIDDLVIAAYAHSAGRNGNSAVYLVYGSTADITSGTGEFDLSDIVNGDGSTGFVMHGALNGDHLGHEVAYVGDVNDDGIDDLIIGAVRSSINSYESGAVYVVFGSEQDISGGDGNLDLSDLATGDGSLGFAINGISLGDWLGHSVSPAGDVNNDGVDDLIIGAPYDDPNGSLSGTSFVLFGVANDSSVNNIAPTGTSDQASATEDQALLIDASTLLANDTDADGNDLSVIAVGNAVNGAVDFDGATQTVTFMPDANFNGSAGFEYTLSDGEESVQVAVAVTVAPVNDAPTAVDDELRGVIDIPLLITFAELLDNDSDIDGDIPTISAVSNAVNGTVIRDAENQTITFFPAPGHFGAASFDYTLSDGSLDSIATVAITIAEPNSPPTAVADTAQGNEDSTLVILAADLLLNDSDDNDDGLNIDSVGNAVNGAVSFDDAAGEISFTPNPDYNGPASFTYVVSDGMDVSTATVSVDVLPVNDDPEGAADTVNAVEDVPLVLGFNTLLGNDIDIDGDVLTVAGVGNAVNGAVGFDTVSQTVTFTPDANFNGSASFEYSLSDNTVSVPVAVAVTVAAVNDAPVATDDTAATVIDTALEIRFADLLGNDTDVDGDSLSVTAVSNSLNGLAVLNAGAQTITFTPNPGFVGTATFEYEVSDDSASDTALVSIDVAEAAPEGSPDLGDDTLYGQKDTVNTFEFTELLANDIDPEGDTLTVSAMSTTGLGDFVFDADMGQFSYTPVAGESQVEFTYTASDGDHSANGTVTLHLYADDEALFAADQKGKFKGSDDNDLIVGSSGKDDLKGGHGNDTLIGGLGNDKLKGGQGNDILFGGAGKDDLKGDKGNDTYVFDLGDGHDKIDNNSKAFVTEFDVIKYLERVTPEDLWFSRDKDDLLIDVIGTDDQVKVKQYFKDDKHKIDLVATEHATLDQDGIEVLAAAMAAYPVPAGLGAEIPDDVGAAIQALRAAAWRLLSDNPDAPNAGADILYGLQNQANTFDFAELFSNDIDEPRDVLTLLSMDSDGLGELILDMASGQFSYFPALDESEVNFNYTVGDGVNSATSTVSLHLYDGSDSDGLVVGGLGHDKLKGGDGDDRLVGGPGNDNLKGGGGNDTYVFDFGDGHDKIDNNAKGSDDDFDVIQFLSRVTPNDLWFSQLGDDLLIDVIGTNDQIEVDKWFKDDNHRVDQIVTATGTLDADNVDVLVAAMAGYSPPEGYGAQWTAVMEAALIPEINAVWM